MRKVEEYIENLPDDRRELCQLLREMIIENVPEIEEKLSFKLPFYHYFGMFLFLNNTKEGIDLVFCRGKDLVEAFPQLVIKERAIMASVCIKQKKDLTALEVRELIVAAAAWNEEAKRLNIPMIKKPTGGKRIVK